MEQEDASDEQWLERGRTLFAARARFVQSAPTIRTLPPDTLPEIAFAGRSNVGKSSLINALLRRNSLARTSSTPGRTQELNFFNLDDRLLLVDLPGYGYAKVSKSLSRAWNDVVRTYLKGRQGLRRVCLLIDARHGLKASDEEIMTMLDEAAVNYRIIFTKTDKVPLHKRAQLEKNRQRTAKNHVAMHTASIFTSARKDEGIPLLRADLAAFAVEAL